MMQLGVKSLGKVHSLGHKAMLVHSLGKKLSAGMHYIMSGQNASKGLASTPPSVAGVGHSNMIYNKSNLGDVQYYPLGRKTIPNTKKSYLEKR